MMLKPKNHQFYEKFSVAAANVHEGAKLFYSLTQDYSRLPEVAARLADIEHEGDRFTHETIDLLNKSFITPLDREDIVAIASRLDSVVDGIFSTSDRMLIYKVKEFTAPVAELAGLLVEATAALEQAFEALPLGKHEAIHPLCVEVNRIEVVADGVHRRAIGDLLNRGDHDVIEIIKLKEIYEHLEDSIDLCEDLADILEGVIIKNA